MQGASEDFAPHPSCRLNVWPGTASISIPFSLLYQDHGVRDPQSPATKGSLAISYSSLRDPRPNLS